MGSAALKRVAIGALVLAGCNDNLPIASFIDKLRVLAVQASPPEVTAGQVTRLSPLVVSPSATSSLWLACRYDSTATSIVPCGVGELDGSALPPACGAEVTGTTCTFDDQLYTTVTPSLASDFLVTLVVADAGSASDCYLGTLKNNGLPTEPDHCVIAYKRVTVSSAPTNHNPDIDELVFTEKDGATQSLLTGDATAHASSSTTHRTTDTLGVSRADDAAEIEEDGSYEDLALSWFTDAGAIDGGRSDFDPADCGSQASCAMKVPLSTATTKWNAPAASEHTGLTHVWAVLRDDRGGVTWRTGELTVTP